MSSEEIIAKVKEHPQLWQTSHPFYRHRVAGAKTWKKIAEELQADDWNVLRKQWKHLKDTFRREMKKLAAKQITTSNWRYYNDLQFVADEVRRKQEKQESEVSETESESAVQQEEKPLKTKILRKRNRLVQMPTSADTTSQNSKKFKKIMHNLNALSKSMEKSSNFYDDDFKNDADYMFLVSLLPTLNNLSDVQRLNFRGKINDWLLNALIDNESLAECDTKSYVQEQIKNANVKEYKVEIEDNL